MGKKAKWFASVKKALYPHCKDKKGQESSKPKKKWGFRKPKPGNPISSSVETSPAILVHPNEVHDQAHSVALAAATAAAADAVAAAAQAAAEIVRLTTVTRNSVRSREDAAAIKIQTAFRGYLARRALRCLRGLARLKVIMQGTSVNRQAKTTLRSMQTYTRVQSQVSSRRIRKYEHYQALQSQLQLKWEKALKASMGDEWNESLQSKQQIEAKLMHKHEASIRREKALAYAFTHQQQWKRSNRAVQPMFTDPINPHWGWSWLERWMAARSWDTSSVTDKDLNDSQSSVKSASRSSVGEVYKSYTRRNLNTDKSSPKTIKSCTAMSYISPLSSTPIPKASSSSTGKSKLVSLQGRQTMEEDDSGSMMSLQSEKYRRHSTAESSTREDESQASSPAVPSYMAPTVSTRAKSRLSSPPAEKYETPDKRSVGTAKKQLHFQPSPGRPSRSSGSPKVGS